MTAIAQSRDPRPEPKPRELPHNYDAEQALLGAILANNGVYDRVIEFLKPEHFADALHGRIFAACGRVIERGQTANPVTLKTLFDQDGALTEIGGAKYLVGLAASVITVTNAHDFGHEILDLAKRRAIIEAAEIAINEAYVIDDRVGSDAQIGELEAKLTEIHGMGLAGAEERAFGAIVMDAVRAAEEASKNPAASAGITSGLEELDKKTGGFWPGDLILVGARPSMGKTAFGSSVAISAAFRGAPVGFISLEMTEKQLAQRHLASVTGISVDQQRRGPGFIDIEIMLKAQQDVASLPLFIADKPALTLAQIRARARRMVRQRGIKLLVIDYLGLIKPNQQRRNGSRNEDVGEISQGLKALGKELGIPVIALCQLSRGLESREDKRPSLSDLRDSGSLEQDADVVIFIHRDEYYLERAEPKKRPGEDDNKFSARVMSWNDDMRDAAGVAELIIAKQRQGPICVVKVAFDGARTTFSDLHAGGQQ